mmetsp:Transcript_26893/g.83503  ORF Transcript_26893/g.83503 Transcript_26893/m.83503 type:complete len:246 (-) Transcript_26893:69-806(-)
MVALEYCGGGKVWEEKLRSVDSWLSQFPQVALVASRCGVQPWAVAAVGACWTCGFLLWGFTGELLCTVVGLLYPMYASFRALEDAEPTEVAQWLTYWVVHAAITLAECFLYRMLVWLPFYHILRLVFTMWLFLPSTRGAGSIYGWVVAPLIRRYRPCVDAALSKSSEELQGTLLNGEFQSKLRSAMNSGASCAHDLGIDDLVAQELTKAAAAQIGRVACGGSRTRTASPRPSFSQRPEAADSEAY